MLQEHECNPRLRTVLHKVRRYIALCVTLGHLGAIVPWCLRGFRGDSCLAPVGWCRDTRVSRTTVRRSYVWSNCRVMYCPVATILAAVFILILVNLQLNYIWIKLNIINLKLYCTRLKLNFNSMIFQFHDTEFDVHLPEI